MGGLGGVVVGCGCRAGLGLADWKEECKFEFNDTIHDCMFATVKLD